MGKGIKKGGRKWVRWGGCGRATHDFSRKIEHLFHIYPPWLAYANSLHNVNYVMNYGKAVSEALEIMGK